MQKYRVTPDHFDIGPTPRTVLLETNNLEEARTRAKRYAEEFSYPAWVGEWSESQNAYVIIETIK